MSDGVWLPQEEFDELVAWKNRHLAAERSRFTESMLADGIEEFGMRLLESRDRVRDVLAAVGVTIQRQLRLDQERIAELELELEQAEKLYRQAQAHADQTIAGLNVSVKHHREKREQVERDSDRRLRDWDVEATELQMRLAKFRPLVSAARAILIQSYVPTQGEARRALRAALDNLDPADAQLDDPQ